MGQALPLFGARITDSMVRGNIGADEWLELDTSAVAYRVVIQIYLIELRESAKCSNISLLSMTL